jgi:hypothetical protein
MKTLRLIFCSSCLVLLAACAKEPPPISVEEFLDNPRTLEAAMVRCGQNRSETKYLAECVNVREAVNRLEVGEKRERREELEAQSERKRQALRRTQAAAAEARRLAAEAQKRRDQAEFLGVVDGEVLDGTGFAEDSEVLPGVVASPDGNAPGVQISPPEPEYAEDNVEFMDPEPGVSGDIESIREELKRRQEEPQ